MQNQNSDNNSNNSVAIVAIIVIALLAVAAGYFLMNNKPEPQIIERSSTVIERPAPQPAPEPAPESDEEPEEEDEAGFSLELENEDGDKASVQSK